MLQRIAVRATIAAVALVAAVAAHALYAGAQPIPGIPPDVAARMHLVAGCHLPGVSSRARSVFGQYALALSGSGQIPASFFPNGTPATANVGAVWCRFNRAEDVTSDALLVRHQVYTSDAIAAQGFNLAVSMQAKATPENAYTLSKHGSLVLAVRKFGEVMALRGDQIAVATWLVPTQQPDPINRAVTGQRLIPMMSALLCPGAASSC